MTTKDIQKKAWQAPQIFDLDVKATRTGTSTCSSETTFPNDFTFAPSS